LRIRDRNGQRYRHHRDTGDQIVPEVSGKSVARQRWRAGRDAPQTLDQTLTR
jgi:hypothetical protein